MKRLAVAMSGTVLSVAPCAAVEPSAPPDGLTASALFGAHAVLQSGMPVPVWGRSAPGRRVTVSFAGQTATAECAADGQWKAVLPALAVSTEPRRMTLRDGINELVFEDVLVGEVWLVCGRSNIGFNLEGMLRFSGEKVPAEPEPQLRLLKVSTKDPSERPLDDFETRGWAVSSPATAPGFSAVGWVFGSELQKARGVPVGIVMSSWGGSRATMWIERSFFEAGKKGHVAPNRDARAFEEQSRQYHQATDGQAVAPGVHGPGACFNSHIHPLIPMAMRGVVVFFDGSPAEDIRLLAENWRSMWGLGKFPFIYVQVHRQGGPVETDPNPRHDGARADYVPLLRQIPNSAMVVALDTGVQGERNIHPPNKRPVGERAARAARALAYGEKIVSSGPIFTSLAIDGNRAVVSFDAVGGGLVAKGGPLAGFAVTGDGTTWVWGDAAIDGETVVVTAPGLARITGVRYAFAPSNPPGNLYNKDGLPASPFSAP